jgi:hypothetical protein
MVNLFLRYIKIKVSRHMIRIVIFLFFVSVFAACVGAPSSNNSINGQNVKLKVDLSMSGQELFVKHCKLCHGIDGRLQMNGAKDFTVSELSLEDRIVVITEGKNAMTPFKKILKPEEIKKVAQYTIKLSEQE